MKILSAAMLILAGLIPASAQDRFLAKDPPRTILEDLKRGNARFAAHRLEHPHTDPERRRLSVQRSPALYAFATILSCSDSRVPVELIFDVGVMDVCVLRVPGNTLTAREISGIEYNFRHSVTPLIIVMGHSDCELAATALDEKSFGQLPPNLQELVRPIREVTERVKEENPHLKEQALLDLCIRENVLEAIRTLFQASPDILEAAGKNKILVVGAVYDLKTGKVEWLDHRRIWNIMNAVIAQKEKNNRTALPADAI